MASPHSRFGRSHLPWALGLALALLVSGCTDTAPSPQELQRKVAEVASTIQSYRFEGEMAMNTTLLGSPPPAAAADPLSSLVAGQPLRTQATLQGAVDYPGRRMEMAMKMSSFGLALDMSMFVLGNDAYVKVPFFGGWVRQKMSDAEAGELFSQQDQLNSTLTLLQVSQPELAGSETVGGEDSYIVRLTPDRERLIEFLLKSQSPGGSGAAAPSGPAPALPTSDVQEFLEGVEKMEVTYWVSKRTFYPTQQKVSAAFRVDDPQSGTDMRFEWDMTLRFSGYNQPVSITLPPEAEAASELPSFGGGFNITGGAGTAGEPFPLPSPGFEFPEEFESLFPSPSPTS